MTKVRLRRAAPSQRSTRPRVFGGTAPAPQPLDEALRDALRSALKASLSGLAADLERLATRLSGKRPHPVGARPGASARTATAAAQAAPTAAAEPLPRACAVIGCRNPVRSLGYCAAHYQKRRLMVATGRLHRLWVEDAAPHSLPDVILSRQRRAETKKAAPSGEGVQPGASPRAWVRKKGQPAAPTSSPEGTSPVPVPGRSPAKPQQIEDATVTATLERWATEFRTGKRRG